MRNKIVAILIGLMINILSIPAVSANQKLTLVLDWLANPNHAPIFVAQQQGFFKKNHLDVTIITPADPADPPKWIAMGRGDIGIDYQPHVVLAMAKGLPIVQVGTLIDQPLNCLVTLTRSGCNNLKQLKGKRIAYSSPDIDLAILQAMLARQSLTLQDVTLVNVHFDLMQALLSGKVAAAVGMMRNVELPQLQFLQRPSQAFYPEQFGVPRYSELVFISHLQQAKDPRLPLFLKAVNEGRRYLLQHPQVSWQQIIALQPSCKGAINERIFKQTLDKFAVDAAMINTEQANQLATFLHHSSLIQAK